VTIERALIGVCTLLAASAALAQSRAPLADVDTLEPAVDTRADRSQDRAPPPPAAATAPNAAPAAAASREPEPAVSRLGAPATPDGAAAATAEPRVAAAGGGSRVIDSLDLGTTSITGNQELPKVLYIVPWKRSDLGDLVGRPVNTLLDEVLTPVDPEVFERSLSYYETLYGESEEE